MFSHKHILSGFTVLFVLATGHCGHAMATDVANVEEG